MFIVCFMSNSDIHKFSHMLALFSICTNTIYKVTLKTPFCCLQSIKSLNESLLVPTTSNSLWNSNGTNRCDVCNISCSSKENYQAHILGKKHQKKIRMQYNPTAAASNVLNNISLPSQTSSVGGQVIFGGSGVAAGAELETKRRKVVNGGAVVDSMVVCTICKVVCNSQEVYIKHLAGKRHKAQVNNNLTSFPFKILLSLLPYIFP